MSFFEVIWRRRNLVLGFCIFFGMACCAITSFFPPIYRSSSIFFPQKGLSGFFQAIETLDKAGILKETANELRLAETPEYNPDIPDDSSLVAGWEQQYRRWRIAQFPSVQATSDSQTFAMEILEKSIRIAIDKGLGMVEISVVSEDPERAAGIANTLSAKISQTLKTFRFVKSEVVSASSASLAGAPFVLWETARPNYWPMPFDYKYFGLIGGAIGGLVGLFVALFAERMHRLT